MKSSLMILLGAFMFALGMFTANYELTATDATAAVVEVPVIVDVEPATMPVPLPPADTLPAVVTPINTGGCVNGQCGIVSKPATNAPQATASERYERRQPLRSLGKRLFRRR